MTADRNDGAQQPDLGYLFTSHGIRVRTTGGPSSPSPSDRIEKRSFPAKTTSQVDFSGVSQFNSRTDLAPLVRRIRQVTGISGLPVCPNFADPSALNSQSEV